MSITFDQPANCPLSDITIDMTSDKITLSGTDRVNGPVAPHMFVGVDKEEKFNNFWKFMETNTKGFKSCVNPLAPQGRPQNTTNNVPHTSVKVSAQHSNVVSNIAPEDTYALDDVDFLSNIESKFTIKNLSDIFTAEYFVRLLIINIMIFIMVTIIPRHEVLLDSKIIICAGVSLVYTLIDVFSSYLSKIRAYACKRIC